MTKPSERIKEILDEKLISHCNSLPKGKFLTTEEVSGFDRQAITEFLDEWFGKTEFRNVGHFQVLAQKTEPIEPPTRLIKESKDVPENEFDLWHKQGWNDHHAKMVEIKQEFFPEGKIIPWEELGGVVNLMWAELRRSKK